MKKLLLGLMLLACLTIKAETAGNVVGNTLDTVIAKASEASTYVDTSSTFKAMYGDVRSAIIGLSAGLKVGAEHVYEVLVKQQLVNSITYIIVMVIGLLLIGLGALFCYFGIKWGDVAEDTDEGMPMFIIGTITIIVGAITIVVMLFSIGDIVTGFVNPEYGAIRDIFNFIK